MTVQVELVHDPFRRRTVIGWSDDPALVTVTVEQLIADADRRAAEFAGIDDIASARERADAERLRAVASIVLGGEEPVGSSP